MSDFTSVLANISEAFQSDCLSLSAVLDELDATLGYLEQLESSPGLIYLKFVKDFDSTQQPTTFRGLSVTGGKEGLDMANRDIKALLGKAIVYIQKRFCVTGILKDVDIFDPSNWPTGNDRDTVVAYGTEEMTRILNHFELLFEDDLRRKVEDQWLRLKLFVTKRIPLSERQVQILWPRIAEESRFSCIMKVVSIFLLLPMNTAVCERGFSMMNAIKSQSRSVLQNSTLNAIMLLSIDGPTLESFNPQPAVDFWAATVQRRPGFRRHKPVPGEVDSTDEDSIEIESSGSESNDIDTDGLAIDNDCDSIIDCDV